MQRINCQLAVTLTAIRLSQSFGSTWAERRERTENASIADQHIEPLVAFVEGQCEPRDAVAVFDVERHQCGRAAGCLDLVVEFFEPADRARDRHHMRARLRQLKRSRGADAARGAV